MKKINNSSELLWLFGNIFVALGVAICNKANLGVSMIAAPAFIIAEAINSLSVGVTEYIFQGIILVLLCVIIRRFNWRFLIAFAVAIFYGYILNFFLWLMADIQVNAVWLRWVMLIIGDCITGFGVACFFRTYMPLQVYELFVAEFADRFKFNINRVKWIFDITLLIVSIVLTLTLFDDFKTFDIKTITYSSFHNIGLGTLVTTAINSPIIALVGKFIDRIFVQTPKFPKLKSFLGSDNP